MDLQAEQTTEPSANDVVGHLLAELDAAPAHAELQSHPETLIHDIPRLQSHAPRRKSRDWKHWAISIGVHAIVVTLAIWILPPLRPMFRVAGGDGSAAGDGSTQFNGSSSEIPAPVQMPNAPALAMPADGKLAPTQSDDSESAIIAPSFATSQIPANCF